MATKARLGLIGLATAMLGVSSASAGISGRVLTSEGEPLVGAAVTAYALETADERATRLVAGAARSPLARTRVDAHGWFHFARTPSVVDIEAQARGYAPAFETLADAETATLALRLAPTVRGVVRARGRPVEGATVVWTAEAAASQSQALVARTGADGTYEVPDPREWASGVVVSHPDFAMLVVTPHPLELELQPRPCLKHQLEPGFTLAGRVVEEAGGRPVSGAMIVVDGWPRARSSSDGSFVVHHVDRRWKRLVARGRGLVGEARPGGGEIVIPMRSARRLTGTVRDAKTGAPLDGAVVALHEERSSRAATALTDARGRYGFTHLSASRYRAWVTRPGFVGVPPDLSGSGPIDLRPDASATRHFRLSPLEPLRGRVQDADGSPVAGAQVAAWAKDAPTVYVRSGRRRTAWPVTWTEPDGRFALALEAGTIGEPEPAILVLKPGYAAGRWDSAQAGPPVVTLTRGVEVAGRVTDPHGEPISGVSVTLVEEGRLGTARYLERSREEGWTRTDAQGSFATRVHRVGHQLAFRKTGFLPRVVRGHDPVSGPPVEVTLEPAAEIRGWILRSDGSGVPDVMVVLMGGPTMMPGFTTTQDDGEFVLGDLAPGTYELLFSKEGTGLGGSRTVSAPDDDLRVEAEPSGTIRGRVIDAWTHAPIERFWVELSLLSSEAIRDPMVHRAPSIEGVGGAFTVEEVPVGEVSLAVRAEGYVVHRVDRVAIMSEGDAPALEIALDRGARIRGWVTDEAGVPLADVRVSAEGADRESPSAVTDSNGAYDLRGVLPGRVKLEFRRQKYLTAHRTVEVADTSRVDATLERGLALRGVVVADEVGVPGASVMAHSSAVNAERAWVQTDERGRFTLEGLAPGHYTVEARGAEGGETEIDDVDVQGVDFLRLSIEPPETAVLSGWVTGLPDLGEVQMVQVWARGDGGSEFESVDGSGRFQMEKAPAGPVTIQADATFSGGAQRSTRKQELILAPGSQTEIALEFLDGLVVDGYVARDGMPVAHARVSFEAEDGSGLKAADRTDREGHYVVVGLEPGPYRVSVWGDGTSHSLDFTVAGHDRFDIDITGAALLGVVLDAAGGTPLGDVSVSLWRHGPGENTPDKSMTSNGQGAFAARSLEEGQYRLLASKQGFGQELRELTLRRGDTVEVEIELERSDGLTLEVVDARDGRHLNATVVVRDTVRRIVANRHSGVGSDGTLNIPLAPGRYLLSTSATGYGTVTRPVTAPGTGLRIGLTPGGTLVLESEQPLDGRLRLVDETGEEYVRCWCNGLADIDLEGRRTTVENVTPGTYTLEVVARDGLPRPPMTVAIREGQISRVTLP